MKVRFFKQGWFLILISGIVLYIILTYVLNYTQNVKLLPTLILIGAFTIPVAFVMFFYEHVRDRDISPVALSLCFFVGGILGLAAAATLEYGTLRGLSVPGLLAVGFIEELVKLIFPVAMYIIWRYRHEADGLLFGVAAGMGFASLETMGYGLTTLIQSSGDFSLLQQVLVTRGLLSPAGHAAWTGLVCAQLWRERQRTNRILSLSVIGMFILAIVLHTLWDIVGSMNANTLGSFILMMLGLLVVIIISLVLLFRRFRRAIKEV